MYCCVCVARVYVEKVCWCGVRGGVDAVGAYMGGTRGSGVLASACDVLEMRVVRGVGGVCDMCMCLARGGVPRC